MQMKMAPAASSPRRTITTETPSAWQRRKYALTQISLLTRMEARRSLALRGHLGQVAPGDALELAQQLGGDSSRLGHLAVVLEGA